MLHEIIFSGSVSFFSLGLSFTKRTLLGTRITSPLTSWGTQIPRNQANKKINNPCTDEIKEMHRLWIAYLFKQSMIRIKNETFEYRLTLKISR